VSAASTSFNSGQSLDLLLTTESLLFAALSLTVVLAPPVVGGRNLSQRGVYFLAASICTVLSLVAVSAAVAWWQTFVHHTGDLGMRLIEAAGIGVGIAAEVGIAVAVTWAIKD
jgi:hypothetical protein